MEIATCSVTQYVTSSPSAPLLHSPAAQLLHSDGNPIRPGQTGHIIDKLLAASAPRPSDRTLLQIPILRLHVTSHHTHKTHSTQICKKAPLKIHHCQSSSLSPAKDRGKKMQKEKFSCVSQPAGNKFSKTTK